MTSQLAQWRLKLLASRLFVQPFQRKHQNSASLAFERGIYRWPVDSPHNGPATRKNLPFYGVIMPCLNEPSISSQIWHNKLMPRSLFNTRLRIITWCRWLYIYHAFICPPQRRYRLIWRDLFPVDICMYNTGRKVIKRSHGMAFC